MKRIFAILAALGLIFFGARSQVLNTVEAPYIIADVAFQGPGSGITGFAPGLTTGDSTTIFAALASTAAGQGAALLGDSLGVTGAVGQTQHQINHEVNAAKFGTIGDGNTHPLSAITSFNGQNTTGWSLAQWQTVFTQASFNGTITGTTFALTNNVVGNLLVGQAFYVNGTAQSVTIGNLVSGTPGQSGAVYNLSGTPSGGNVTGQPMTAYCVTALTNQLDRLAVQAAICYALNQSMSNQSLFLVNGSSPIPHVKILGNCVIDIPLVIDRADNGQWGKFRIIGEGGIWFNPSASTSGGTFGGFTQLGTSSCITLFTSTLTGGYTGPLRSGWISFERLMFSSVCTQTNPATAAMTLDINRFDRVWFDNCIWINCGMGYTSTGMAQSLYFRNGCYSKGFCSTWLTALLMADVDLAGVGFEANTAPILTSTGTTFLTGSISVHVHECLLQSNSGGAAMFNMGWAGAITFKGNYFEGNTPVLIATTMYGLNFEDNYIQAITPGQWEVQITNPYAVHSAGNYSDYNYSGAGGDLFNFTNALATANIDIGHGDVATGNLVNSFVNILNPRYGTQQTAVGASQIAEVMGAVNGRQFVNDQWSVPSPGTAYSHARFTLAFGSGCCAGHIRVVCTGSQAGVGDVCQSAEWSVTSNGTTLTLTNIFNTTTGTSFTPITASVSGTNIVLTYNGYVSGTGALFLNTALEFMGVNGASAATAPTIAMT